MQETVVRSLIREDATYARKQLGPCAKATEPVPQCPGASATEPACHGHFSLVP